jgi:LPS sulfotransferase NodH
MEALRFEHLIRGVQVDEQARLDKIAEVAPAKRRYVILFSPRSGSTWLTEVLSATMKLGFPEEYINPDFVVEVARFLNARTAADLLDALVRQRKSPNNVFGIEARAIDVDLLGYDAFRAVFGAEALFFHLWRDNIVAQAISLFRAVQTRHFHSNDGAAARVPDHDAHAILLWMTHIVDMENANVQLLRRLGAPARMLRYEDLVGRAQAATELFAHAMAVPFRPGDLVDPGKPELRKLADDWNAQAEARVRREQAEAVQQLEGRRLIKCAAPDPHPPPPREPAAHDAWSRGQVSGAAGRSPLNNPFDPRTVEGRHWRAGWARGWDTQAYLSA